MDYIGNVAEDSTVRIFFTTHDKNGAAVAPSSAFEAADAVIYKDSSATQKTTTNGVTMTSPFDSVTGLHLVEIDTSNDTGDAGFWATGSDFTVVLSPDETIDSESVVKALAQFTIENRYMRGTDSAATASALATVDAVVDAILVDTDTTIPGLINGLNDLDAAGIRSAVGLASANLDTQLSAIQADSPNKPVQGVALSNFPFLMVDETDFATPETGLTVSGSISQDGGTFGAVTNAVAEVANGVYTLDLTAAEMNATTIMLRFTATNAADRYITIVTQPT